MSGSARGPLVLASASPRRRELLAAAGVAFEVVPSRYPEPPLPRATPVRLAFTHALRKALEVASRVGPDRCVLAADTVVDRDGVALGKPRDAAEARATLATLAGRRHVVHTGYAIVADGRVRAEVVSAEVEMRPLRPAEIDAYVAAGESLDKAGAYGIQGRGATLIARIAGDVYAVVGLPVSRVAPALVAMGVAVPGVEAPDAA